MSEQGPAIADRTPIFSLLGANGVSQVGNMMLTVAIPWFVLETTGSAAKVGLTVAALGVGAALAGFVVEGVGLIPTIVGIGAIYLTVTVGMFFNPALKQMDAGRGG